MDDLQELLRQAGVLSSYEGANGELVTADPDMLLRVLQLLGLRMERIGDAPEALRQHHLAMWRAMLSPCTVVWGSGDAMINVHLPEASDGPYELEIQLDSGESLEFGGVLRYIDPGEPVMVDGTRYVVRRIRVPINEHGYHRVTVRAADRVGESLIIAAPNTGHARSPGKRWGVFAPLYALRGSHSSGAGDLGDLTWLRDWTRELGGGLIGTLPLLAGFLSEPFEPSPYSPVSRLFWNELYIHLPTAPGYQACDAAQRVLGSATQHAEREALRDLSLVDYRLQMAHKRRVLEQLSAFAWQSSELQAAMADYAVRHPRADDYAKFRAATEARGQVWTEWPEQQARDGVLGDADFDERSRQYHLYVQFAMDAQLARLADAPDMAFYLDLSVGVNRCGYDTWRERDSFVMNASVGAPPDMLFSEGQNWGLPPLHPHRVRERGYRYFIDCVRNHVEHAGLLRIDHAMGLHRLYWIPDGASAKHGVYVQYRAPEQYAILCLESARHRCELAGEDLGVVPDYVRPAMAEHGVSRLYVGQFSLPAEAGEDIAAPPVESIASLNTHDMPTLRGYWYGRDIDDQIALGLITEQAAVELREDRARALAATAAALTRCGLASVPEVEAWPHGWDEHLPAIMRALTEHLGRSDAHTVLVTVEDLWLEPDPQNVPGTGPERPNWRRKLARLTDDFGRDEQVLAVLRALATARQA